MGQANHNLGGQGNKKEGGKGVGSGSTIDGPHWQPEGPNTSYLITSTCGNRPTSLNIKHFVRCTCVPCPYSLSRAHWAFIHLLCIACFCYTASLIINYEFTCEYRMSYFVEFCFFFVNLKVIIELSSTKCKCRTYLSHIWFTYPSKCLCDG